MQRRENAALRAIIHPATHLIESVPGPVLHPHLARTRGQAGIEPGRARAHLQQRLEIRAVRLRQVQLDRDPLVLEMDDFRARLDLGQSAQRQHQVRRLRAHRRVVTERIRDAQELGTSQNDAEYDDAKMEQAMLEGRILEKEDILRRSIVIDEESAHRSGRIVLGSRVEVEQNGKHTVYTIVGAPEADAARGRISNESPVGAALFGKQAGESVDINVPRGVIKLRVLKID